MKEMAERSLPLFYNSKIPTVGELRGKIWVVTTDIPVCTFRINTSKDILFKGPNYWVQNYWNGPQNEKEKAITELLENCPKNYLKVNFLSQAFGSNMNNYFSKYFG